MRVRLRSITTGWLNGRKRQFRSRSPSLAYKLDGARMRDRDAVYNLRTVAGAKLARHEDKMKILMTGGAGYIGSHTALALFESGHEPIIVDDFSNSRPEIIDRLSSLAGRRIPHVVGSILDHELLNSLFENHSFDAVIHFAAKKSVVESVADPLAYHRNNVGGLLTLIEAMEKAGLRTLVFSSSATVYGDPDTLPIAEDHPTRAVNPYGQTKLICENILSDLAGAQQGWRISLLRYFNPVGAHASGMLGEDPLGTPTNLMPLVVRVALGADSSLPIFGRDYPTTDGSAVRDYIHVVDLAEGHVAALKGLVSGAPLQIYNLGRGRGVSVLELVNSFETATGQSIHCTDAPRRVGDVAEVYAAVGKAERELRWRAKRGLEEMCADSWRFALAGRRS